jgi:hypothetical protein
MGRVGSLEDDAASNDTVINELALRWAALVDYRTLRSEENHEEPRQRKESQDRYLNRT